MDEHPQPVAPLRSWLGVVATVILVVGAVVSAVLVSLAHGRLEPVKMAYGLLIGTSITSSVMAFIGLRDDRKTWARVCLVVLLVSIAATVYGVRMMSLAYTFQMNLY